MVVCCCQVSHRTVSNMFSFDYKISWIIYIIILNKSVTNFNEPLIKFQRLSCRKGVRLSLGKQTILATSYSTVNAKAMRLCHC